MSKLKISVIIPAYNEQDNLTKCLCGLHAQTRQADEIIVVDNNSTDDTVAIAKSYGARVIYQTMQGIPPTNYAGLNAATGDILVRCDADCIIPATWLKDIENAFTTKAELAALTGPGYFYDCNKIIAWLADIFYMKAYFAFTYLALAHPPLFGSNFAIRAAVWKSIHKDVHYSRVDIHDDMDISIHLPVTSLIKYSPSLKVGISARALRPHQLPRRYIRGFRSLIIHWPDQAPWQRWRQKLSKDRAHTTSNQL